MKIIKTYILIYESFVQFEVVLANYFMQTKGGVITVGFNEEKVNSFENFITLPHLTLDEVDVKDIDLFIIPGGEPENIPDCNKLYNFLKRLNQQGTVIGAICSGPLHLAKAGLLKEKKYTTTLPIEKFEVFNKNFYEEANVVKDRNIITAKASGYVDFAIEVGKKMDIYKNEEDLEETIRYFKYFNKPGEQK